MIQVRLKKGEVTPDALLLTGHISEAIGPRSCRIEEGAQYVGEDGLAYCHGGGLTSRPGYRDLLRQVADDEPVGNGKPVTSCESGSGIVRTRSWETGAMPDLLRRRFLNPPQRVLAALTNLHGPVVELSGSL